MTISIRASFFLLLIYCVTFSPLTFGYFYAVGDMRDVFIPLETFFHEQTLQGHLPAWLPDAAWGFPVIASAQIGYFYPPLFLARLLPLPFYLPFILILHFFWLGLGTFIFLRLLKRSAAASFFGAAVFSLSGFVVLHITHLNIILTIAWLPWLMIMPLLISRRPAVKLRLFILYVFSIVFPFLAGQIQIPVLCTAASLMWFIYLQRIYARPPARTAAAVSLIIILSAALASTQLLPTFELAQNSSRASSSGFDITRANQHSYPLYHLPLLLFPRFYGNDNTYWGKRLQIEYGFYVGTIPFILAIISIFSRIKTKRWKLNRKNQFWFWLFVISFLLSLGGLSPFRIIGLEPSLWIFSAPARWLLFSTFSLTILISQAFENIAAVSRKSLLLSLMLLILAICAANLVLLIPNRSFVNLFHGINISGPHSAKLVSMLDSARSSSLSLLSFYTYLPLIAILAWLIFHRHKRLPLIIIAVTVLELAFIAATTTPVLPWSQILTPPHSLQLLPESVLAKQTRVYSVRDGGDTGAYFTNPKTRANTAARETQRQLIVPLTHTQYGIAGVEWPASLDLAAHAGKLDSMREPAGYNIINLNAARQLNIGAILSSQKNKVNVSTILPSARSALRDSSGAEIPLPYPASSPSQLNFSVYTNTAKQLIVRDTYYPGWIAVINGRPATITKFNGIFRSVNIPPGQSEITFQYSPRLLYLGMAISFTLLVALSFLLFSRIGAVLVSI